jgi:hypothetical protein
MTAGQNGNDLYQQGLARETAGDLKGAMQIFERIVRDVSADRALTAKALVQLGRWSDLLGQNQARTYYERVVREFADQKEVAADARARLESLTRPAAAGVSPARRMIVDSAYTTPTHDGRHHLRYSKDQRAFELVEFATGAVRRLTADGPDPTQASVESFELSKDGRRLAASVRVGPARAPTAVELRVFDVGGRGPGRVLATWEAKMLVVRPFAWAPRDDRIWLFVRRGISAQFASVDMSANLEVLKTLPWRDDFQAPSLSPDGKFLAYHDAPDRQLPPDLFILATDGSREHRVEHAALDTKPMFLPDGSGVVFESHRRGASDLWFLEVADGRPTGVPRLVWRDLEPFGRVLRFADTGSLIFDFYREDWGTYTVPLDLEAAAGSIGEATRLAPVNGELIGVPAFSADGRYLAHFRTGGARIVIQELATGLEREIPLGVRGLRRADWCSSGDALIAAGYIGGIGEVAYRVNVKDASVQRLPIAPSGYHRSLCVGDGEEILYVPARPADPNSIVRRSLASGRETTLFTGPVALNSLERSVDGKRLAFITSEPNGRGYRVVTLSAAGGDISAHMSSAPGDILVKVVWMPSGDRLLAVRWKLPQNRSPQEEFSLWEVPLTGAAPRKLGLLPVPRVPDGIGVGTLSVYPDGKRLAFSVQEGSVQQTWAIDNLFQFIKAGK